MTAAASTVRRNARGTLANTRIQLIASAQYRANTAIWSIASVLQVVVYLSVWLAVTAANGGSTGGYDARDFAGYFLVTMIVREIVTTGLQYHVPHHVHNGKLAILLLRPVHPMAYHYGHNVAYTIKSLIVTAPIAILLAFWFDARIDPSASALAYAVVVLPLALITRGMCDALVACSSLWLVRIDGIRTTYVLVGLLLGGQFAPLDVLPGEMETVARALPFYWSFGFPVELLSGRAQASDAWVGMAVLACWSAVLYVALQVVWRAGLRAYESVGQ